MILFSTLKKRKRKKENVSKYSYWQTTEKAFICLKVWHIASFFLVWFQKLLITMCAHTRGMPACRGAFLFIYSTYIRHAYTLSYYVEIQWTHLASGFRYIAHQWTFPTCSALANKLTVLKHPVCRAVFPPTFPCNLQPHVAAGNRKINT